MAISGNMNEQRYYLIYVVMYLDKMTLMWTTYFKKFLQFYNGRRFSDICKIHSASSNLFYTFSKLQRIYIWLEDVVFNKPFRHELVWLWIDIRILIDGVHID